MAAGAMWVTFDAALQGPPIWVPGEKPTLAAAAAGLSVDSIRVLSDGEGYIGSEYLLDKMPGSSRGFGSHNCRPPKIGVCALMPQSCRVFLDRSRQLTLGTRGMPKPRPVASHVGIVFIKL